MKTYWEMKVYLYTFLTSALVDGEWSASCPSCCTPRVKVAGTDWIGDWMGPRTSLDLMMKRCKFHHSLCWE